MNRNARNARDLSDAEPSSIHLRMTPMIDVVFLLLVFFLLTIRIVSTEGDLNVQPPAVANAEGRIDPDELLPLRIHLRASGDGELVGIQLNGRSLRDTEELRALVIDILGEERGGGTRQDMTEAIVLADERLRYTHTMAAVTAVSGRRLPGGAIAPLIRRIRLAPPPN